MSEVMPLTVKNDERVYVYIRFKYEEGYMLLATSSVRVVNFFLICIKVHL